MAETFLATGYFTSDVEAVVAAQEASDFLQVDVQPLDLVTVMSDRKKYQNLVEGHHLITHSAGGFGMDGAHPERFTAIATPTGVSISTLLIGSSHLTGAVIVDSIAHPWKLRKDIRHGISALSELVGSNKKIYASLLAQIATHDVVEQAVRYATEPEYNDTTFEVVSHRNDEYFPLSPEQEQIILEAGGVVYRIHGRHPETVRNPKRVLEMYLAASAATACELGSRFAS